MNPLFEQFFKSADQFINLGKAAPLKQSTYGKQHNEPTKNQITAWNGLILDIEQSKEKLENYTANSIKAHNQDIDTQLGWFRELPRRMDYVDCHWSAYYTKIDKCLDNMHDLLIDIDTKYHLGQHRNDH